MGLLLTTTSCNSPSNVAPTENVSPAAENVEQNAEAETNNIEYMTILGLMKGHLIVAKELLDAGKPQEAEPHVGHPVDELYSDLEEPLNQRNIPQFNTTLTQFHDLLKTDPNNEKIPQLYQESMNAIDGAIAAIPETERQSPQFILTVVANLLDTAQEEYSAAILDGKVVELLEYQDSRGFVIYADQLYQTIAPSLSQEKPEIHQVVSDNLTALKKAWPSVEAPATIEIAPDQVSQLVTQIDEQVKN